MRFSDDSILSIDTVNFPSGFRLASTCISSANGRMLLACNQLQLFDSTGNVLSNFQIDGLLSFKQSALFLKLMDGSNNYYLLNNRTEIIQGPNSQPLMNNRLKRTYLTKIKVDEDGYQLISVDTLPRQDTIQGGGLHACRHANGRDWWIFKSTFNQKQYLRGLLTPYSLNFELYNGPGPDEFESYGRNQFSSDGTKFFHYITSSFRKMQIYDFDRCTGELSNFREIDFAPFIPYPPYDLNPFVLSPDGSKIYMGRSNPGIEYSYQNIQVDVQTGEMTLVADSVFVPCLTPNLKWVVSGYQAVPWTPINKLNVFTQPNNSGNNVGRIKDLYSLPVDGFTIEQPEWANHLLGPIDGSSCDTLGLDDETVIKKVPVFNVQLFPNPGNTELNLKTDLPLPAQLTIRDAQGKTVLAKTMDKKQIQLREEVIDLPSGIYFVELSNMGKGQREVRKWMKVD